MKNNINNNDVQNVIKTSTKQQYEEHKNNNNVKNQMKTSTKKQYEEHQQQDQC